MSPVPVKPYQAPIMEGDDHLMRADSGEPMWVLEAEGASQVCLAGVADAVLGRGAFSEVIGPQDDGVEMIALVEGEDMEGIVLGGVSKGDARSSDGVGKAQVQDEVCVLGGLLFGDVGGADAQDGVVLEDAPEEAPGGVVVFPVVYGCGGCQVP